MIFPWGYHQIHPDVSMNFQMNRWFGWVGAPAPTCKPKTPATLTPASGVGGADERQVGDVGGWAGAGIRAVPDGQEQAFMPRLRCDSTIRLTLDRYCATM